MQPSLANPARRHSPSRIRGDGLHAVPGTRGGINFASTGAAEVWTCQPTKEVCALPKDGSHRLLIVEDDRRTQDALKRLFTYCGWEVQSATTTAEGLRMLEPPPT